MTRGKFSAGFTLMEMVMVMVITGIIAGMVAVFITTPVKSYFSSVRRAELTEEADSALRLVARDLQSALPNSITCNNLTSTSAEVKFLSVRSGGRFREAQTNAGTGTPLAFGSTTTGSSVFSTIGSGADSVTKDARGNVVTGLASQVVVGNLSSGVTTCHSDYSSFASNAAPLSSLDASSVTITRSSSSYPVECQLASPIVQDDTGTAAANEANNREFGRFYVIKSTPDIFLCDTTNGLTRNGSTIVAPSHVSACQVACDTIGGKARVQLITFNLTLKDRDNEPVNMLRRVTINNRP